MAERYYIFSYFCIRSLIYLSEAIRILLVSDNG